MNREEALVKIEELKKFVESNYMFKPGDKVVVTNDYELPSNKIGDIAIVVECIDNVNCQILFERNGLDQHVKVTNIELYKSIKIKTKHLYKDCCDEWYINSEIGSIECEYDGDFRFINDFYVIDTFREFEVEEITTSDIKLGDIIIYTEDIGDEIKLSNIYFCNKTDDENSHMVSFIKIINEQMLDTGLFYKNSNIVYRVKR